MTDLQGWLDRVDNLLQVQKDLGLDLISNRRQKMRDDMKSTINQLKRILIDHDLNGGEVNAINRAIEILEQKPKTGHWINGFCSKCGKEAITEWNETGGELCLSDFCPNCGAKMESEG